MKKTKIFTIEYGHFEGDEPYVENREHFVSEDDYAMRLAELTIRFTQKKDRAKYYIETWESYKALTEKQIDELLRFLSLASENIEPDKPLKKITIEIMGE